ncbi:acylneuraminate cytidylyltransferase family protein [Moorena producens JHB]|uniref:Acylneuraminate cytidylyltransferase family protein n=1 Tax=Moorena producens (strain JHB) TaxID=1454205 RepID=A0A1D9G5W6_MOOP1|nr:acylneuraminate cytidylyltransferase family protein [Moorena producens]AOY82951.1 acylneuraminate cytidylyltransferase family protein [Moorena producens JHB]
MDSKTPTVVALIPARAGSKRVPGKNIRRLKGHPLIAYTIAAATQSQVFSAVIVSTDSEEVAEIARYYNAEVPFLRPPEYATDKSPDIEWIDYTLRRLNDLGRDFDCFSILRPTSPCRQPQTIQRAWQGFLAQANQVDSLRAVEKCQQHPGKMWVLKGSLMKPLLEQNTLANRPRYGNELGNSPVNHNLQPPNLGQKATLREQPANLQPPNRQPANLQPANLQPSTSDTPWHSTPYQALPEVYVQNASLEIAWSKVVLKEYTIAGKVIMPFITHDHEGLDINDLKDWWYLEYLIAQGEAHLPMVSQKPM